MLNILVWNFENKLFSGEVTVGFYELNNSREILDVPNNTILRKKRIGKILTTSIKQLETFHLMREYPGCQADCALSIQDRGSKQKF